MIGIYKITNPKGNIYVGQSKNIVKREKQYSKATCPFQRKLYHSILKYGWESHTFEIIHTESEYCKLTLDELEIYYIDKFNCLDRVTGLNLKHGGAAGKLGEESLEKMAKSLKDKAENCPIFKAHLFRIARRSSAKRKGVERDKEVMAKIHKTKTERGTHTMKQESRDKMAATIKQRFKDDPSFRERMVANNKLSNGNKKHVRCTVTGRIWESCDEMCKEMGLNVNYTRKQLHGSRTNFTTYEYIKTKP